MVLPALRMQGFGMGAFPVCSLPDAHPFYALIGRVAAEWARLEHNLDLIIWDLLKSPEDAAS